MKRNIILENSIKSLDNILEQEKLDKIFDKYLKEENIDETNVSGNISGYSRLISDIVRNLNDTDDMKYFCSVIESFSPEGKIPVSSATNLTGKDSENGRVTDTLRVIQMASTATFTEGADITASGGATGTILFLQNGDSNQGDYLLVKVNSGTFTTSDTINTVVINNIYPASYMKGFLPTEYANDYTTANGEVGEDFNEVAFLLKLVTVSASTKKISTDYTKELLQDLLSQYKKNILPLLVQGMSNIIRLTNRQKTINFMKDNAYVRSIIDLANSPGANGGVEEIYEGLYSRINQSIGTIGTNTGIRGKYAVIGSSNVVSGLKTVLKDRIKIKDDIMYLPHDVVLIEDGYSQDDYLLVTLRGNKGDNNSSTIFSPYSYAVVTTTDPVDLQERVHVVIRSDVKNNALATQINDQSKNEMMELTVVEGFGNIPNTFR